MFRYAFLVFFATFGGQTFAEEAMLTSVYTNGFTPLYGSTSVTCNVYRDRKVIVRKVANISVQETFPFSLDVESLRAIQEKIVTAKSGVVDTPNTVVANAPTLTMKSGDVMLKQMQDEKDIQINQTEAAASLAIFLQMHCP